MKLNAESILSRIDGMCSPHGAVSGADGAAPDPMTTAQLIVLAQDIPKVKEILGERIHSASDYVRSLQNADGGWTREGDDWHTSVTAWSLLGLTAAPSFSPGDPAIKAAVNRLSKSRTPDGGFSQSDEISEPNTYSSSYSIAAIYSATSDLGQVTDGLTWLKEHQDSAGGFQDDYSVITGSDPSLTAYVAHALARLPVQATAPIIADCARFIASDQRPSGAWSAWYEDADSAEGTAAALRVLLSDKNDHSHQIKTGLAYLYDTIDLDALDNWIVISLAYLMLGELSHVHLAGT